MQVNFTAHNIRLDNGTLTKPEIGLTMDNYPWFKSAKRILDVVFPGDRKRIRIADLGCLEGGYATEFARMGFRSLGIEVRENNIAACQYVKANTNLPNLEFAQDDAWNIAKYGPFDAVFCCGLLYHIDRPKKFLESISAVTRKLLIVQTHFATETPNANFKLPPDLVENEGIRGRWYSEFENDAAFKTRDQTRWSSWDNRKSFWVQREYLLQTIHTIGFDLVMEQFDSLGGDMARAMLYGQYKTESRGTFIGIKTS